MLTELRSKGGAFCEPARQGKLRCPLLVRSTSEDVITGHIAHSLRAINPRWWLPDLLNEALGRNRFRRQVYRRLRIEPWVNQPRLPPGIVPWREGRTQVDLCISWENPATTIFIEAKYLSDLSPSTTNADAESDLPADQLIRNIRVGLNACGRVHQPNLFHSPRGDFVAILLTPQERHPLVDVYRDEERLRQAMARQGQVVELPQQPFIGQITYPQIESVLKRQRRWFSRSERVVADTLIEYLELKRNHPNHQWNAADQSRFEFE